MADNNSKNIFSHHCLQRIQLVSVDSDKDVPQGSIRQIRFTMWYIVFYIFNPVLLVILLKGNKMCFNLNLLKRVNCNDLVFVSLWSRKRGQSVIVVATGSRAKSCRAGKHWSRCLNITVWTTAGGGRRGRQRKGDGGLEENEWCGVMSLSSQI